MDGTPNVFSTTNQKIRPALLQRHFSMGLRKGSNETMNSENACVFHTVNPQNTYLASSDMGHED